MKILYCASECVPFIKTGGLADVAGSLPVALVKAGVDARVVLPRYRVIDGYWQQRMEHVCSFHILFGWETMFCGVEKVVDNGVTYYFIDNQEMFSPDNIYGDGIYEGYRFAFFCRAILEMLPRIDFVPDVLHLNDWQTGLVPAMLRTQYCGNPLYDGIHTVYSIHNLRYQGIFDWSALNAKLGFDKRYFTPQFLEFFGCLSCMKAGLVFADRISTVSPSYAEEIKTAYYGEQLDGLLRARGDSLSGILNGIDTVVFDPATDRFLERHYSASHLAGKAEQKTLLQKECNLEVRPDVPIISMIARLTSQKGLDLVECVLSDVMRMRLQLVFLGMGDKRFCDMLNWAQWRYPNRIYYQNGLNEGLAHRIYAGSDMFLMPSQFEPCGLSQMISLRYGTLPIVRETGGLRDSVQPYNQFTDEGNGFSFANYNAHEMLYTIERAVHCYYDEKAAWQRMQQRAMETDFSWATSTKQYLRLYEQLAPIPQSAESIDVETREARAEVIEGWTEPVKQPPDGGRQPDKAAPARMEATPPQREKQKPQKAAQENKI